MHSAVVVLQLLSSGVLPLRERLRVLLTVSDILKGQGEALNIDRKAFYTHLYQSLLLTPFAPLYEHGAHGGSSSSWDNGSSGRPLANGLSHSAMSDDVDEFQDQAAAVAAMQTMQAATTGAAVSASSSSTAGAVGASSHSYEQPTAVLLVRCLEQMLLGVKHADMGRLAAFNKRMSMMLLQVRVYGVIQGSGGVCACTTKCDRLFAACMTAMLAEVQACKLVCVSLLIHPFVVITRRVGGMCDFQGW